MEQVGCFANDSHGTLLEVNSLYTKVQDRAYILPYLRDTEGVRTIQSRMHIQTSRPLGAGDEVFVPYGKDYWKDRDAARRRDAVDDTRAVSPSR